jgi:hypothetical protein
MRNPAGVYMFSQSPHESFSTDRRRTVEWLSSSLTGQKLYEELNDRLDRYLKTARSVLKQLHDFYTSATDLDDSERQILKALMSEYF